MNLYLLKKICKTAIKIQLIFAAIFVVLFFFTLCVPHTDQGYFTEEELGNIVGVEIVKTGVLNEETWDFPIETLCVVSNVEDFLADIQQLEYNTPFRAPSRAPDVTKMFRVIYADGGYDLIDCFGQSKFDADGGNSLWQGTRTFDEQEFKSLIQKYSQEGGAT